MRNRVLVIFEFFAIFMYIAVGLFFLLNPGFFETVPGWAVRSLGILLVLYGVNRIRRAIRRIQQSKTDQDNE